MVATSPLRIGAGRGSTRREFAPVALLLVSLTLIALLIHGPLAEAPRLGVHLAGGRLLPVADLGRTWADYLASWHAVAGGTTSPAPPSLLVLAALGTVVAPVGGPPLVAAVLLLGGLPLAGLTAYLAGRALGVSRQARALGAAAYALVPVAASSAAQGRLDVVVAHVLVPPLLVGLARVLGLTGAPTDFRSACVTALGMAALGAFAPLPYAVLVLLVLAGFVVVAHPLSARRVGALATVVVLPVVCLLPWPVALLEQPDILVHGPGARVLEEPARGWLLVLSPDGSPAGWLGGLLVLVAAAVVAGRPRRSVVPGAVLALAGWITASLVDTIAVPPISGGPTTTGWPGGPLVLVAAGLVWIVLAGWGTTRPRAVTAPVLLLVLAVLTTGTVLAGRSGPLHLERPTPVAGPLLMAERGPFPARLTAASPRFGEDDLVPTDTAGRWLGGVRDDLLSGDRERVRGALAAAVARGVRTVAVPPGTAATRQHDLVADEGRSPGGQQLLRLRAPAAPVELLGPDLARRARSETRPSPYDRPVAVPAALPHFAVRVSEGGPGRVLVLGAENEPGWSARIDGREAPLASAWGHQVAVPLPRTASEVRVSYTELPRMMALGAQATALAFLLIGALAPWRRGVFRLRRALIRNPR